MPAAASNLISCSRNWVKARKRSTSGRQNALPSASPASSSPSQFQKNNPRSRSGAWDETISPSANSRLAGEMSLGGSITPPTRPAPLGPQTGPALASAPFLGKCSASARSNVCSGRYRLVLARRATKRGGASRGRPTCVVLARIPTKRGAAITEVWGWGSPNVSTRDVEPRRVLSPFDFAQGDPELVEGSRRRKRDPRRVVCVVGQARRPATRRSGAHLASGRLPLQFRLQRAHSGAQGEQFLTREGAARGGEHH